MQSSFKSIEETSSKDGIIRVEHVNDIERNVLCVRVLQGTKGNRYGYDINCLNSFSAEDIQGLHQFFELLSVITHFLRLRGKGFWS
jgi:hypothetical protein